VRKINPVDVRTDFNNAIAAQELFYNRLRAMAPTALDRKQLAEQVFFVAACLWEGFVSDLFVAYGNNDSTALVARKAADVSALVTQKHGATVTSHVRTVFPRHLKASTVAALLDDKGYNVTFATSQKMVDKAHDVLVAAHQGGFSGLSAADKAAVDAWKAVRNCVAHRSKSSFDTMNLALQPATLGLPYAALARGAHRINDVGSFMDASPAAVGHSRLKCYLDVMRVIASRL
jgi:hypothetical protein